MQLGLVDCSSAMVLGQAQAQAQVQEPVQALHASHVSLLAARLLP